MNDLDGHTQACMFTIVEPLAQREKKAGTSDGCIRRRKEVEKQKGSWEGHCRSSHLFRSSALRIQLLDLPGLLILFY